MNTSKFSFLSSSTSLASRNGAVVVVGTREFMGRIAACIDFSKCERAVENERSRLQFIVVDDVSMDYLVVSIFLSITMLSRQH